jgi:hypothetical protein
MESGRCEWWGDGIGSGRERRSEAWGSVVEHDGSRDAEEQYSGIYTIEEG